MQGARVLLRVGAVGFYHLVPEESFLASWFEETVWFPWFLFRCNLISSHEVTTLMWGTISSQGDLSTGLAIFGTQGDFGLGQLWRRPVAAVGDSLLSEPKSPGTLLTLRPSALKADEKGQKNLGPVNLASLS